MRINDKLKLNRFQVVRIPCNREYFSRFGMTAPNPYGFTGDADEVAPAYMSKMDAIGSAVSDYESYSDSWKDE